MTTTTTPLKLLPMTALVDLHAWAERVPKETLRPLVPDPADLDALEPGDLVQIMVRDGRRLERLWVQVAGRFAAADVLLIFAKIIYKPFLLRSVQRGDEVVLEPRHVFDLKPS